MVAGERASLTALRQPVRELSAEHQVVFTLYQDHLADALLVEVSRRKYLRDVLEYLAWLTENEVSPRSQGSVSKYRQHLRSQGRASATVSTKLAAIRSFHEAVGLERPDVRGGVVISKRTVVPGDRQLDRYVKLVMECPSARDRALALAPYCAGLHIGEITALDVSDIDLEAIDGEFLVIKSQNQGGSERRVPIHLHPNFRKSLHSLISQRAMISGLETSALFLNRSRSRISDRGACAIISKFGRAAAIERGEVPITPLALRYAGARQLEDDEGADALTIKDLLSGR
jgi:site-specific recombinase XerD